MTGIVNSTGARSGVIGTTVGGTNAANVGSGALPVGVTGGSGLDAVPGRYFYAYKNDGSNQAITASTFTLCTFESATQSHSSFSLGNNYFTGVAADAGTWFFAAQISYYTNSGNIDMPLAQIYLSDSNVLGGYKWQHTGTSDGTRHFSVTTTGVLNISNGSTIKLYGYTTKH